MTFSEASAPQHLEPEDDTPLIGGVVMCHGFTSTPQSMLPWAEALAAAGYEVILPLLPGHGTTWQELAQTKWSHWAKPIDDAVRTLSRRHSFVAVCGLSMGGTLSLLMAQRYPNRVDALCLINPAIAVPSRLARFAKPLSTVIPSIRSIASDIAKPGVKEEAYERTPLAAIGQLFSLTKHVRSRLKYIATPVFLATSKQDHVVPPQQSDILAEDLYSDTIKRMSLERSFHVATLDYEADEVFAASIAFLQDCKEHNI